MLEIPNYIHRDSKIKKFLNFVPPVSSRIKIKSRQNLNGVRGDKYKRDSLFNACLKLSYEGVRGFCVGQ